MTEPYPFTLEVAIAKGVTSWLDVQVSVIAGAPAYEIDDTRALLRAFESLQSVGAFVSDSGRIYGSTTRADLSEIDRVFVLRLETARLDPRAFVVLLNSLAVQRFVGGFVDAVALRSSELRDTDERLDSRWIDGVLQHADYPAASAQCSFELDRRIPGSSRTSRRAVVEFINPLSEQAMDASLKLFDAWCKIAFGGYPCSLEDLLEGEGLVVDAAALPFDESSIELTTDFFGADESVWNPLINVVEYLHRAVAPVASLTLW